MDNEQDSIYNTLDRNLYRQGMEQDSSNDVMDSGNLSIAPVSNELTGAGDLPPNTQDPDSGNSGSDVAFTEQGNGTLQAGKLEYNNVTPGYILGIDSTDGLAKFFIGNSTNYLNWDGVNLILNGVTITGYLTSSLASGHIFVGSAGGVATDVAMSGDATLIASGAITLATVNSNVGTFTNATVTVNAKGLVTAASSGASGSVTFTVNSDEMVSSWVTSDLPDFNAGTGSFGTFWSITGTSLNYASGAKITTSGASMFAGIVSGIGDMFIGNTGTIAMRFVDARTFKLKGMAQAIVGSGTGIGAAVNNFWGVSATTGSGSRNGDITVASINRAGFAFYNGNYYIMTCDGSTVTSTSLGTYSTATTRLLQIVVNGTTSVDFYVDGVLVGTITTNVPASTDTIVPQASGYTGGATTNGFNFLGKMILSQRTS